MIRPKEALTLIALPEQLTTDIKSSEMVMFDYLSKTNDGSDGLPVA